MSFQTKSILVYWSIDPCHNGTQHDIYCHHSEGLVQMLNVFMLCVFRLCVVMLCFIILNVLAPSFLINRALSVPQKRVGESSSINTSLILKERKEFSKTIFSLKNIFGSLPSTVREKYQFKNQ